MSTAAVSVPSAPQKPPTAGEWFAFVAFCFGLFTAVSYAIHWADEGFVKSIHDAAHYHDLYFLDWWDVAKFYTIFVCASAFDIFFLHEIPKWVKFVAIVGLVPAVVVLSLM
jgi:hypothetical protein